MQPIIRTRGTTVSYQKVNHPSLANNKSPWRRALLGLAFVVFAGPVFANSVSGTSLACDVDLNTFIDRVDINLIKAAKGTNTNTPNDPRDPDADGRIRHRDVRLCIARCDNRNCAPTTTTGALLCDLQQDNDVDRADLQLLRQRFGETATSAEDLADADGNGLIDRVDARLCRRNCTLPGCKLINPPGNTRPVANAGSDQNTLLGSTVQLDGSGSSDADGDPLSYAWSLKSVPAGSTAQITNPHSINATFQPDLAGTYTLKLLVSDQSLTSYLDKMNILVTADDATVPDVVGLPQADAQALIAAATLATGTISTMPSAVVTAGSVIDQAPTGGAVVAPGTSVDLLISTGPANQPPTADAGPDQSATLGTLITLDASDSTDADGSTLVYTWSLAAPTGSNAALSNTSAVAPTFTLDEPGNYVASLTVSDGTLTDTDSVTVTTLNSAPSADAGANQSAFTGNSVTLDGSASSDVDGDPLTFAWQILSAPSNSTSTLNNVTSPMPSLLIDVSGSWTIQLLVNDGSVDSAPALVVISTENTAPIADAGANQTATVGSTITLDGTGSTDADSDPLTYRWSFTSRPTGSNAVLQQALTPMPTFVLDAAGTYTVQLVVNDGVVDSAPATVNIETTNSAPVADAGPAQTPLVGDTISLDGTSSSDVDGDELTYLWSLTSVPPTSTASLIDPDSAQPTLTIDVAGTYVAQLIVNDASIDSLPDTLVINTANSAPVADAGNNQNGQIGDLISLDGASSTDIDGDPLTYSWSLETTPLGSNAQLTNVTQPNPSFVLDVAGIYVAQLIVADGELSSAPSTVTINTNNTPPLAAIVVTGEPAFVGDTLTFSGLTSTDADNNPLTYDWSVLSAPAGSLSDLSAQTTATTTLVLDFSGDYTIQLIVNDGTTASAPVTANVSTGNSRPIASASATSAGFAGDTISFDGQASSDPDNDSLSYSWSLLSKPATSTAQLSDTQAIAPTLVTDAAGTYVAQLIVSDSSLASDPATAMAVVDALPLLSISDISVEEGDSGNTAATFEVTLSKPISESVSATYATSDGAATDGSDFTGATGTVSFAPGDVLQTIEVTVLGDTDFETDEDFQLTLSNPTRAVISNDTATAVISNDDFIGTLTLALNDNSLLTFATTNATVTSSVPAPDGGFVVTLSSPAASLTLPTTVTIAEGATTTNLDVTAGAVSINTAVTAAIAGFDDASASIDVALRNLSLELDFPLVGVNEANPGTLTLTDPAATAGATLNLVVVDPTVASVNPASVSIAGGDLAASFTVNGLTAGITALTASADGYATQTIGFESTNKIISVAQSIELPLQRSISYPVTIAPEVAPPGGLQVTLASSNTDVVISPTTLLIPEGAVSANAQVIANGFTPATIRATATGFAGDAGSVVAVAELRIAQNAVTFTEGFPSSFDVDLLADNASAVAPSGGLPLSFVAADPTCVAVQAAGTLVENLSSLQVAVDYAGTAPLPCNTSITVSSLSQIVGDSLTITVREAQPIVLTNVVDVGKNLQYSSSAALQLAERFHGGVTVRVESNNPDKVLVARNGTLAGAAVQDFFLADGENRAFFNLQGLAHNDANLAASITVSAPGFANAIGTLNVVDPVLTETNLPPTLTVFGNDRSAIVRPGVPIGNSIRTQSIRVGAPDLSVTIATDNAAIVSLVDAGTPTPSLTRTIPAGSSATSTFQLRGLGVGTANVSASASGFIPLTQSIDAVGPQLGLTVDPLIGQGLQSPGSNRATLGASNHGGVTIRITSSDPSVALVSPGAGTAGTPFVDIAVPDGQSVAFFITHGVAIGQATITAEAPGYLGTNAAHETAPTGVRFTGVSNSTDTLDPNDKFKLELIVIGPNNLQRRQPVRAGGNSVNAIVTSSAANVATIGLTGQTFAGQLAVNFNPGQDDVDIELQPLTVGTTTLSATATAAGFTVQPATSVSTTITAPTADSSRTPPSVGAGLQRFTFNSGRPDLRLSAANHGGIVATLTSSDPAVLRVSSDNVTAGTATAQLTFVDGDTVENFAIHGIAPGTATLSFDVPGFTTPASRTITVAPADLSLQNLPATTDTLDPDLRLAARTPTPVRIGGGPLSVSVVNSDAGIATLVVDGNAAQSQTVVISEGSTTSPQNGNPPVGALLFRPLSTGSTTVTIAAPGFNSDSASTLVTTPSISLENAIVGEGLRSGNRRLTLGASDHGGITGQLCSTSGAIALVALTTTDPGSVCVDIDFTPGQTTKFYYVHGIAEGSVNLQMTAPGFLEASAQADIETSFISVSIPTSVSLAAGDRTFLVRVGVQASGGNLSQQPVNATIGALPFTLTSSNGAVAELVADGTSSTALQLQINAGVSSKSTVLRPLSTGTTTIEASSSGLGQATGAVSNVAVTP